MTQSFKRIRKLIPKMFIAFMLFASSEGIFAQAISTKELIDRWVSIIPEKEMTIEFLDSSRLMLDGAMAHHLELSYWIEKLEDQHILNIQMPTGFILKLWLWKRNKDQIKIYIVDAMYYKEPMKHQPAKQESKAIILKRSKVVLSA